MTTANKRAELLQIAIKSDVAVDRWDNIKYTLASGKQVRINFKKNVIRTEVKYGNAWSRINSTNIKDVNLRVWQERMDMVYNEQNNVGYTDAISEVVK